ncbi:hypothetical protein JMJ55_25165 [Belnapia sp. T6]|uniref:Uncharacterized protein n=1 Tax=Belnapia mucosa TaxID=2804532 RepID=A0ABS1VAD0_9PROT|nr:hypothetical protein [Belnapia mucosa]MBL6458634.1 hypothetical protein [Belnapia mucosa]
MAIFGFALIFIFPNATVGEAADFLLTNARPPEDRELPPTAYAVPYAAADLQRIGGQGHGLSCSIDPFIERLVFAPSWIEQVIRPARTGSEEEASISLQMRQACAFHDLCYRHGAATYGYTQADCDYLLLEHAYRICQYIYGPQNVNYCIRRSRLVVLGVRIGGREFFRPADAIAEVDSTNTSPDGPCRVADWSLVADACASSYFEFDPYPIRATNYTVYRVADAPEHWANEVRPQKALYVFRVRPSGTQVLILGWANGRHPEVCDGYELPGTYGFLNIAPQVVASVAGDEWFTWWRRHDLAGTGGSFAFLSPRRARLADWKRLFPGAKELQADLSEAAMCTPLPPVLHDDGPPASFEVRVRLKNSNERNNDDFDPNFSEIHTAPGIAPHAGVRLMALRTTLCGRLPCHLDVVFNPTGPEIQEQKVEPLIARDALNRNKERGDVVDFYRNFQTAPIPLTGPTPDRPVLAWMVRGDRDGQAYTNSALLRRLRVFEEDRGGSAGVVRLTGLLEEHEPLAVLARTTMHPRLVSIAAGRVDAGRVSIREWALPPQRTVEGQPTQTEFSRLRMSAPAFHGARTETVRVTTVKSSAPLRSSECNDPNDSLDWTWMTRPPTVMASKFGEVRSDAMVVFTRLALGEYRQESEVPQPAANFALEVRLLKLAVGPSCEMSEIIVYSPEISLTAAKEGPEANKPLAERRLALLLAQMRSRPVLPAYLQQGGRLHLIIPDPKTPGRSLLLRTTE